MQNKKVTLPFLFLAVAFSAALSAQEGAVKYRQAIMKSVAGHAGAIAQIAYGGVAFKDHLNGHITALVEASKLVPVVFQEKAMTEDPPTRAKPDIWEKWSEFEEKANDFERAVAGVSQAADGGDLGAVAASLDPLWDSCKGCHKPFRVKQE